MYTKGVGLFFGLSAMSSLRSNLRASRELPLISSGLYPLSLNLGLNLSRDAFRFSWSNFVGIIEIHGSFHESVEY